MHQTKLAPTKNKRMEDLTLILEKLNKIESLTVLAAKTVLTIDEATDLIGLSKARIYALCSKREIPYYKQGNKLYFKRKEVEDWMTANRQPTRAEIESKAALYCHTH